MRKSETFERGMSGQHPVAWLERLRALNGTSLAPFAGTPKLSEKREDYPSGACVVFTGVTGDGTVTLSWDEPDTCVNHGTSRALNCPNCPR